ncbi:MAG: hypothetical protein ACLQVJ_12690 [Syntrophobacteraceae bacterium]
MSKRAQLAHLGSLILSGMATTITLLSILSTLCLALATVHMAIQTREMADATKSMAKETQGLAELSRTEFAIKSFPALEIANAQLTLESNHIENSFTIQNPGEVVALQVGILSIQIDNTNDNSLMYFTPGPALNADVLPHSFHNLSTIRAINDYGLPFYHLIFVRFRVPLISTYHYQIYAYDRAANINPDGKTFNWSILPTEWRYGLVDKYCSYIGDLNHSEREIERKFLHDYIQEVKAAK